MCPLSVNNLEVFIIINRNSIGRPGPSSSGATGGPSTRGDKAHRQLIDCIRGKDTDALLAAVAGGSVDVNFTDDVGQTLLNWASAFGTKEMVEFLCEKGINCYVPNKY